MLRKRHQLGPATRQPVFLGNVFSRDDVTTSLLAGLWPAFLLGSWAYIIKRLVSLSPFGVGRWQFCYYQTSLPGHRAFWLAKPFKEPSPEKQQDGFCLGLDSDSGIRSPSSWPCDLGRVSWLSVFNFLFNIELVLWISLIFELAQDLDMLTPL